MEQNLSDYKTNKTLVLVAYLSMVSLGLIKNLKGPVIPSIRAEFLVDYTHIGQMLFVTMLGFLIATFLGGMMAERYGVKKILVLGSSTVIIASGLFIIMPSFYAVAGTYFVLGIGLGCLEIGVNALGAKIFIKNSATMMNRMHLFFGVGAITAPKFAGIFVSSGHSWKLVYLLSIVLSFGLFILISLTKFPELVKKSVEDKMSIGVLIKSFKIWIIAIILGLFVFIEAGIANWLINYLQESKSMDLVRSTNYLTWFFITFTLGRFLGGILADKIGYIKILLYFAMITTILIFAGIIFGQTFAILFSLVGFFVSILFPTTLVLIMKEYSSGVSMIMGFVITVSGIFNMVGNWGIGKISDVWGLGLGLASLGIGGMLACILLLILKKQMNEKALN